MAINSRIDEGVVRQVMEIRMLWSACSEEIQQQRIAITAFARADQHSTMSRDSYKNAVESVVHSCLRLSEATLAVLATPTVLARIYDGDVGECLGALAETVELLLDICLDDSENDAEMARVLTEAARTIAASMKRVSDTWPWRNEIIVGRSLDEFDAGKGVNVRDIIDDLQS